MQTGTEARTVANRGFETCHGQEEMARTAAQRARMLLDAEQVPGGCYPVVVNPSLAGVFVHEAFGHLSESDFLYENEEARKAMRMGRRFGRELLNIADSGVEEPARDRASHGPDADDGGALDVSHRLSPCARADPARPTH